MKKELKPVHRTLKPGFEIRQHAYHKHIRLLYHTESNTCIGSLSDDLFDTELLHINGNDGIKDNSKCRKLAEEYIGDRHSVVSKLESGWSTKDQTWFVISFHAKEVELEAMQSDDLPVDPTDSVDVLPKTEPIDIFIDEEKSMVRLSDTDEWFEVQEDQEGEPYFLYLNKARYLSEQNILGTK